MHELALARSVVDIVATPGEAWCMPCAGMVKLASRGEPCPACGSCRLTEEMAVREVDVA